NDDTSIPRPLIVRGKRIPIQRAMGLKDDDRSYKHIQSDLRKLVYSVGLDLEKDFRLQDQEKLSVLYRAARKKHLILKKFENNWATAELVKMYLQNARGYAREE
ncbi:hypothetical protein C8Q74DRAFT_1179042, partial [Fomes fomentarius]